MTDAQRIIGAWIRALREQQGLTLSALANRAGISYQYLSGVENGKENFSVSVLEALAGALSVPLHLLVATAYENEAGTKAPTVDARFFRQTPLPDGLTVDHLRDALNLTQHIIHRINRNMAREAGTNLQSLIQANNFSGLVSNVFSNAMDECSPYKHNHDQRYPDLIHKDANDRPGEGLEVKMTIKPGKGGESHNGHSGWHVVACYGFLADGDILFKHVMFANLNGHNHPQSDWTYVGSRVNETTGSRRTETYTTNLIGTTKLRDGTVYLDPEVNFSRWKQGRIGPCPPWSIFYQAPDAAALPQGRST